VSIYFTVIHKIRSPICV